MTQEKTLQLISLYCRFSTSANRKEAFLELQLARLQRESWKRNRDLWYYQNAHHAQHAYHIDMCRIHRRAAELVEKYGIRTPKNSYPVTL